MQRTHDVTTPDGRILHVHEDGDPQGRPVVVHHGTPMSGLLYAPHALSAREQGLRLIGYDRPGYGGSTPHPGRTVGDCAADVATILAALDLDRFATWGMSGGGPHALACAALLPERCAAAASVAGVAPWRAEGLDWLAGMGEDNVVEFSAALEGREVVTHFCASHAAQLREATAEAMFEGMRSILSDVDVAALTGDLGAYFADTVGHGLPAGVDGWVDDDLAFTLPWGFDLGAIEVPVLVWQGRHDLMVPPAHGEWLGAHVAAAEFRFSEDEGHVSLLEARIPQVHTWLSRYTF